MGRPRIRRTIGARHALEARDPLINDSGLSSPRLNALEQGGGDDFVKVLRLSSAVRLLRACSIPDDRWTSLERYRRRSTEGACARRRSQTAGTTPISLHANQATVAQWPIGFGSSRQRKPLL
jgi:hypothetical protein